MNSSFDVLDFLAFLYISPGDLWVQAGLATLVGGMLHAGGMLQEEGMLLVLDEALNLFLPGRSPESFLPSTFLFDLL